jgi:Ca2+-binding RTX toxin-like protein
MKKIAGPANSNTSGPVRSAASADPYAGTVASNGKDIWDVPTINENLNRTGQDWYTDNYGELNDGVLNFGFWTDLNQLLNSYYVNATGTFALNEAYYYQDFSPFNAVQIQMATKAINLWDDLVAISFQQTSASDADITYGNTYTGGAQAYAYLPFGDGLDAYYGQFGFNQIGRIGGDVWVDGFVQSNFEPAGDSWYSQLTLIHETGHALGLSHPGNYDALDDNDGIPGPDPITYTNDAAFFQDSLQYTVMSYFDAYETGAQHIDWKLLSFGYASTPLLHDVSAIQAIYGADMTTRTGDTTYGFNSNAGRSAFDFSLNRVPIVTIWDAGGNDTLDLSGYNTPSVIDLNPGAFSSAGGIEQFLTLAQVNANRAAAGLAPRSAATFAFYESIKATYGLTNGLFHDNISIAYGVIIENATGGGGDDLIISNAAANTLNGGGGIDTVSYRTADSGVIASLILNAGLTGEARGDRYISIEKLEGSNFNDILTGSNGNDAGVSGLGGDDLIYGGNGNDILNGNDGRDILYGGNQNDTLDGGAGNDWLLGADGNDRLLGGAGDDVLSGDEGVDFLDGGAGSDQMSGGAGKDVFNFSNLGGTDRISDFYRGDKIDVSDIDAKSATAAHDAFTWIGTNAFTGVAGQLRMTFSHGDTTLMGDVDGDKIADFTIIVDNYKIAPTDMLFA